MAITFPRTLPPLAGIAGITMVMNDTVALSRSPFTLASQTLEYPGQMWLADVTLPKMSRASAAAWVAWLASLRGRAGTFLLGDLSACYPRGDASVVTVTGQAGDATLSVVMTGTLLAGDYIQIGTAVDATLHMVLADQTGDGSLEVWPSLRKSRTGVLVTLDNPTGVFRLASNERSWSVNAVARYGITLAAEEVA